MLPWLHYDLDKEGAFRYTCMTKLKTIYHDRGEAVITRGYRNLRYRTENFRVYKESNCHKGYVDQLSLLKQFVVSMKALIKH